LLPGASVPANPMLLLSAPNLLPDQLLCDGLLHDQLLRAAPGLL